MKRPDGLLPRRERDKIVQAHSKMDAYFRAHLKDSILDPQLVDVLHREEAAFDDRPRIIKSSAA